MTGARSDHVLSMATVAMTPDLDPEISRQRIGQAVERVIDAHPDVRLILFGETILGWFYRKGETAAYHRRIAEPISGPSAEYVARLAQKHDVYISFGLSERDGDALFNTQLLIDPSGEIIATHRKFWIRNRVFTAGERRLTTAKVDRAHIALLICADARSFWLLRAIRRARVDVVLASLADYGTSLRLNRVLGTFFDAWTIVANRYGEEPPLTWHGLISMTDRLGRLRGSSVGREGFVYQRVPIGQTGPIGRASRRFCAVGAALGFAAAYLGERFAAKLRRSTD